MCAQQSGPENESYLLQLLSQISGIPTEKIKKDMPLFGRGLGLDSLSGTTLMAALGKEYGVTLGDIDLHMNALDSVGSLQAFLHERDSGNLSPNWERTLTEVAALARLKEGRAGVERVLAAVFSEPGLTSRELAARCALPTPTVAALRKEMVKAGLLAEQGSGAHVAELGQQIARGYAMHLIPTEHGEGAYGRFEQHALFPVLVEQLTAMLASRPEADTSLDQAKALPETTAARALLALEYGALAGRRVAIIGDDDFTSIGLAALGRLLERDGALGPELITVLDIDDRILRGISNLAVANGYAIKTFKHDLRYPVPTEVAGSHHAFFTDPPYTTPGATVFLSRGLETCNPQGSMAFFSYASKGPVDMVAVQRSLLQMGLLIREVMPGFNRYEGASLWGNQSQMLVCEGTASVDSTLGEYEGPLYTADLRGRK